MAEAHRIAIAAARRQIDQGAGNRCGGCDRDRGGAHHRVMQLAHRQCAHAQVDVVRIDLLAGRRQVVGRRCHEGDLRRVLAARGHRHVGDQAHPHRAVRTDRLEHRKPRGIVVDRRLQLAAGATDIGGIDEDGGDAGVDHRGPQRADARHLEVIDQVPGREQCAAAIAIGLLGGIKELQHDLRRREGHAVQFEVAGFLHLTVAHRHMREDGLADVGLPDPHRAAAVVRHPRRIDQAIGNRERPHRRTQVAAVAAPVDERAVDATCPYR